MAGAVAPRLAHGLLVHGDRLQERARPDQERRGIPLLIQEDFWTLTGISKKGGTEKARELAQAGCYYVAEDRVPLRFGPGLGLMVGVSLGGESLRAGIVDANGRLHHEIEAPRRSERLRLSPQQILDDIAAAV